MRNDGNADTERSQRSQPPCTIERVGREIRSIPGRPAEMSPSRPSIALGAPGGVVAGPRAAGQVGLLAPEGVALSNLSTALRSGARDLFFEGRHPTEEEA